MNGRRLVGTSTAGSMMQVTLTELFANMPAFERISSREELVAGAEGNSIELFIHQPEKINDSLPCVVHLHTHASIRISKEVTAFRQF